MANFDPPIASVGGVTRPPSTLEKNNGFQCGPADFRLFNFLFQRIEAELKSIQDEGGITGDDADPTTVRRAIQAMIAAATGGGDTSQFVLFSQAQARLPIFPEVMGNDGVIPVTDLGGGTVRVPASVMLHRGIRTFNIPQTDLVTLPSKVYHLRWNPIDGLALKDTTPGGAYNPTSVSEASTIFDTVYDDVLLAKISTNVSNVPTIINLKNKHQLVRQSIIFGTAENPANVNNTRYSVTDAYNWGRAPTTYSLTPSNVQYTAQNVNDWDYVMVPGGLNPEVTASGFDITRYRIYQTVLVDFTANAHFSFSGRA